jgi:arylsulfatase A-like enzyme
MTSERPNIILLVTDHQLHYRHGWDGGQGPLRPAFNHFAQQGVSFDRAYTVTPLCGPARRSLLCGRFPHYHRNLHNQSESPFIEPTYLDQLQDLGYSSYSFGKWHAGPGTALDHHCEGFSLPGYGNPYTSKAYEQYCKELGLPKAEHKIDTLFWNKDTKKQFPELKEGNTSYQCTGTWCGETAFGITTTQKETHEAFFLAHLACNQLKKLASQNKPFHLRVDFWGPHQPYFPTQEYVNLYDPSKINEYGIFRDNLQDKPEIYKNMNQPIASEQGKLIVPSVFPWQQWQELLAKAYAQTTMIDDAALSILKTLDELEMTDNTLVIWTSDHGDALASHGGMFDKGSFMTEETVRIPLALRYPKKLEKGLRCPNLVSNLDIVPTILGCAGSTEKGIFDGQDLFTQIDTPGRQELLLESYGQGYRDTKRSRTLVTESYKYTRNEDDIDELYNLEKDPYELVNLHNDPNSQTCKKQLAHRLKLQLIATKDPEKDIFFK